MYYYLCGNVVFFFFFLKEKLFYETVNASNACPTTTWTAGEVAPAPPLVAFHHLNGIKESSLTW